MEISGPKGLKSVIRYIVLVISLPSVFVHFMEISNLQGESFKLCLFMPTLFCFKVYWRVDSMNCFVHCKNMCRHMCFHLIMPNKRNPLFYCCSRIRFQIPVFELCKIWIKKLNNYSTTEWFSAKRHKVKHRKSWKLLNWDQLQSDFPSLWMGISSWEVHNIIGKGQTNLPTCAKLILSQPFAQTPGRTKKRQL